MLPTKVRHDFREQLMVGAQHVECHIYHLDKVACMKEETFRLEHLVAAGIQIAIESEQNFGVRTFGKESVDLG